VYPEGVLSVRTEIFFNLLVFLEKIQKHPLNFDILRKEISKHSLATSLPRYGTGFEPTFYNLLT